MLAEILGIGKFLLGFAPWLALLVLPTNGWDPLRRAVAICLVLSVVISWKDLRRGFILQWATLMFFLFCAVSLYGFKWIWLAKHMGIFANAFLSGIIWLTVLIGKPFTLQYARAELPKDLWYDQNVVRGSRFIAIFWGVLLLIPTAFSAFRLLRPSALPAGFFFGVGVLCIMAGVSYTTIYKRRVRKQRRAKT